MLLEKNFIRNFGHISDEFNARSFCPLGQGRFHIFLTCPVLRTDKLNFQTYELKMFGLSLKARTTGQGLDRYRRPLPPVWFLFIKGRCTSGADKNYGPLYNRGGAVNQGRCTIGAVVNQGGCTSGVLYNRGRCTTMADVQYCQPL